MIEPTVHAVPSPLVYEHLVDQFRILVRNVAHFGSILYVQAAFVNEVEQTQALSVGHALVLVVGAVLALELVGPG